MINLHLDIDILTLPEDEARKKIDDINKVAGHFTEIKQFDEAKYCSDNALCMAEAINYIRGIADANSNLGMISYGINEHEDAIGKFLTASKLYNSINEFTKEADVYSYLGISYRHIDDYSAMIDVFFKALYIYRERGNEKREGNILNSIGNYYLEVRQEALALEYYDMTLKMKRKQLDIDGCIRVLFNIGLIYYNIAQYEKSLRYYSEALNFNHKIEQNPFFEARINQNVAGVYRATGKYEEAEKLFLDCIDYYEKSNMETDKCDAMQGLAILYTGMRKWEKAERLFGDAEALAKKLNSKRLLMLIYRGLADQYKVRGDFKKALIFRRLDAEYDLERNKTIEKENIRKLNVLHRVDITKKETKILTEKNEELKKINNKLMRLNDEKNYFLNLAANDLQIPLEKISEKISLIKHGKENIHKELTEVLIESSHMQSIISDLLTINESESAK
jgi:tetratricopeptide (TPR) repeat protein